MLGQEEGRCQVSSPGVRCHLPTSASLQASRDALLDCAGFLGWRNLSTLVQTHQIHRIGECLVRIGRGLPQVPRGEGCAAEPHLPCSSPEPTAWSHILLPCLQAQTPQGLFSRPLSPPCPQVLNKTLAHVGPGRGTEGSQHCQAPSALCSL